MGAWLTASDRILLLGGSSFIGKHLFVRLGSRIALATYQSKRIDHGVRFDARSMSLSDIIPSSDRFSHAVILMGMTNPDACFRDKAGSTALNVTATKAVIDQAKDMGIVPVFLSTESVFDGTKGAYVETDPVSPIFTYGAQKAEIEDHIRKGCEKYLIVRLARVFGSTRGDGTLLMNWMEQIERNLEIRCAADQIFSPIHVDDVVEALVRLMRLNCTGIFHVCNPDSTSRSGLLKLLIEAYGDYTEYRGRVVECRLQDFPAEEKRPLDLSMKPDKLVSMTGIEIKGLRQRCREIAESWANHR